MKNAQCPRCKSFKTNHASIGIILFASGCVLSTIALFLWPLFILSIPLTLVGLVLIIIEIIVKMHSNKPFAEKHKCKECGESFKIWKQWKKTNYSGIERFYKPVKELVEIPTPRDSK